MINKFSFFERRIMPRINRKYYKSTFLHIMVQGINKENIFKNDFYKNLYIKLVNDNIKEFDLKILAYVIMSNHAHILLNYSKIDDVSKFMHRTNQTFAQIYNKCENRVGYVFRGRYKCEQIKDKTYLYNVLTYIHFNPIKAKMVKNLSDYKYSSYNQYLNGNIENQKAYIIFNTYEYKKIFKELHEEYFNKYLKIEKQLKTCQEVIKEFKNKNKISTTELIVKENNLLIQLILDLENNTNLNDKQISELLKIGKNKICNLKKRLQ